MVTVSVFMAEGDGFDRVHQSRVEPRGKFPLHDEQHTQTVPDSTVRLFLRKRQTAMEKHSVLLICYCAPHDRTPQDACGWWTTHMRHCSILYTSHRSKLIRKRSWYIQERFQKKIEYWRRRGYSEVRFEEKIVQEKLVIFLIPPRLCASHQPFPRPTSNHPKRKKRPAFLTLQKIHRLSPSELNLVW